MLTGNIILSVGCAAVILALALKSYRAAATSGIVLFANAVCTGIQRVFDQVMMPYVFVLSCLLVIGFLILRGPNKFEKAIVYLGATNVLVYGSWLLVDHMPHWPWIMAGNALIVLMYLIGGIEAIDDHLSHLSDRKVRFLHDSDMVGRMVADQDGKERREKA